MNPKKEIFLKAKDAAIEKSPGVGPDGTYYDPWGVPYIITLDVNNDDQCLDAFYGRASVSEGPKNSGLQRTFKTTRGYEVRGSIMVWSTGPDRTAHTEVKANQGVNKDNILSW